MKIIKEKINDLEKFCKNNFSEINIKEINNKLLSLEKNSQNYLLYEEEFVAIHDKNRVLDIQIKENNEKTDTIIQDLENCKIDIKQIIRKVDSMNCDLSKLSPIQTHIINEYKSNNVDMSKLVSSSSFNENIRENSLKFEKIQKKFNELTFELNAILDKLSHTPSDSDFSEFQEIIKSMLDNIIIKNKKQFANKMETVKSYKLLETKLNSMNDSYKKKLEHADNWLLAKKPINPYQCASCESIIKGDLEQKSDYIPWNKYPYRDENISYRMGHGFSHMLHMINEGLMRDNGEMYKDEEKKKGKIEENNIFEKSKRNNVEELSLDVLPKVKKKSHIYDLRLGVDSPLIHSRNHNQINYMDSQDSTKATPHIMKILKKNRSLIYKTNNNLQTEKQKNIENIKNLKLNLIDKDIE